MVIGFRSIKKLGIFQLTPFTNQDTDYLKDQKERFLTGKIENPVFVYPFIDENLLKEYETHFRKLKKELLAKEKCPCLLEIYRKKINLVLSEVLFAQSIKENNIYGLKRFNEFSNCRPEKRIIIHLLYRVFEKIKKGLDSQSSETSFNARQLVNLINFSVLKDKEDFIFVDDFTFLKFQSFIKEKFKPLFIEDTFQKEELEAQDIVLIFQQVLKSLNLVDWKIILNTTSKNNIYIDTDKKEVNIPQSRKVSFKKLQKLILHEIGIHILRRENGQNQPIALLENGFDRYLPFEEGLATACEQIMNEKFLDFSGVPLYLPIILVYGLDSLPLQPRNFRQVYEIMWRWFLLERQLNEADDEKETSKDPKTRAWEI